MPEPRMGKESEPGGNCGASKKDLDRRVTSAACQSENWRQVGTDCGCELLDRAALIAVGREFEKEIGVASGETFKRVKADEMHAKIFVERLQFLRDVGPWGIAERRDRRPRGGE
jgi:hypothetical protein